MRKLKISAFAADFGANQNPRAFLLREISGVTIALNEWQFLVKDRSLYIDATAQCTFDDFDFLAVAAEEEHLRIGICAKEFSEPNNARVVVEVVVGFRRGRVRVCFKLRREQFAKL